jgi:hypothetical protein
MTESLHFYWINIVVPVGEDGRRREEGRKG